jgi:hypothetical protein
MRRSICTDPLYIAATIAQSVLETLTHRVATIDDMKVVRETIERLEAARKRHREPDLSLFEEALKDVEVDL